MKVRMLRMAGTVAISSFMFLAFFTVVGLAAPARESHEAIVTDDVTAVKARDEITTVIGIDDGSPLRLSREGQLVAAMGTVACPEEGTYDLRVMVFQQEVTSGIAKGETSGDCSEDGDGWQADAQAVGRLHLTTGKVQVCAVVVVHLDRSATTQRSCRTMSLGE